MSGSAVEIDFFRAERESSPPKKLIHRRPSFHDIQGVISKINPELLKTAIASASAKSLLPVYNCNSDQSNRGTAPLTIFYNGNVTVFDVSHHQAESILKLALGGSSKPVESTDSKLVVPNYNTRCADLPHARKTSLRRFLEKRRERQTSMTPYAAPTKHK